MKKPIKLKWAILFLLVATQFVSCKKDKEEAPVIASFTSAVDGSDYKKVNFTSQSQDYESLAWDFGEPSSGVANTSTVQNPSHTYATVGVYKVKLTATSSGGSTDSYTADITIADPNALLTKLTGDVSKTWKLLRDVSNGEYPLEVGPATHLDIWWAMGRNNNELENRPCMLNDEWTFTREGLKMDFDDKGDYWAEGGLFSPDNICASSSSMVGPLGEDLSAWGSGSHTFVLTPTTLQVVGNGAFLGLCKVATDQEVKVPQASVTYNVLKLVDGAVDTLVVQTPYTTGDGQAAYWRFILVHYDDPTQEPPIPGPKPIVDFTIDISGLTITCNNATTGAISYLWDFGDGQTSTAASPTHTYAGDGYYSVELTATNANGSSTKYQANFFDTNTPPLTEALLQGSAWKVLVTDRTIFVGPGLGTSDWWICPKAFLDGSSSGADDWSCITDDEFTFGAGGVYTYNTNGSARNDGYMGTATKGCISDAELAASGNGAAFGSATHSYSFTPGSNPIITLTNGTTGAAFLGFYKGYYGGENSDGANPPNGGFTTNQYEVMGYANSGTKEYLFVTVDLSADHSAGSSWSVILVR